MKEFLRDKAYINGEWKTVKSTFPVFNPYTGDKIGDAADCSKQEAEEAVKVAHETFTKRWKKTCGKERAQILKKWGSLMINKKQILAELVTMENGKPIGQSLAEIQYSASFLDWCAEEARRTYGATIPSPNPNKRMMSIMQPVGVAAAITPWNFPSAMITRKACAAIAAGCTVVLKPAEDTPFSALALAQLSMEAGLPPGVFNVLPASRQRAQEIGEVLCTHHDVAAFSFTGSTATGKKILQQSASTVKKVGLELGGLAPFIVFESADVDAAVKGAMAIKFRVMGQSCICANRFYVHENVHDEFVTKLTTAVTSDVKAGNPMDPNVTLGPLINEKGLAKVEDHLQDALSKGAKVMVGGKRSTLGGTFFDPTLITNVTSDMKCCQEETFGPLIPVMKFNDVSEVVAMANNTRVGLGAYFYSKDVVQCWRVAENLEVGMVGVNDCELSAAEIPFGGVKESGLGREGSSRALEEYLETKYICWGV